MTRKTWKRLWFEDNGDFSWVSSARHMIDADAEWETFSPLLTIDTNTSWQNLRAIMRTVGVPWSRVEYQTSPTPFDEEE